MRSRVAHTRAGSPSCLATRGAENCSGSTSATAAAAAAGVAILVLVLLLVLGSVAAAAATAADAAAAAAAAAAVVAGVVLAAARAVGRGVVDHLHRHTAALNDTCSGTLAARVALTHLLNESVDDSILLVVQQRLHPAEDGEDAEGNFLYAVEERKFQQLRARGRAEMLADRLSRALRAHLLRGIVEGAHEGAVAGCRLLVAEDGWQGEGCVAANFVDADHDIDRCSCPAAGLNGQPVGSNTQPWCRGTGRAG